MRQPYSFTPRLDTRAKQPLPTNAQAIRYGTIVTDTTFNDVEVDAVGIFRRTRQYQQRYTSSRRTGFAMMSRQHSRSVRLIHPSLAVTGLHLLLSSLSVFLPRRHAGRVSTHTSKCPPCKLQGVATFPFCKETTKFYLVGTCESTYDGNSFWR